MRGEEAGVGVGRPPNLGNAKSFLSLLSRGQKIRIRGPDQPVPNVFLGKPHSPLSVAWPGCSLCRPL